MTDRYPPTDDIRRNWDRTMQTLVRYGIFEQRGIGIDAEFTLDDRFRAHLGRFCKDSNKEELSLWTWFELIKSFNRRSKAVIFGEVPYLALAVQAMHNIT